VIYVMVNLLKLDFGVVLPNLLQLQRHKRKNSFVNDLTAVLGCQDYVVFTQIHCVGLFPVSHVSMILEDSGIHSFPRAYARGMKLGGVKFLHV